MLVPALIASAVGLVAFLSWKLFRLTLFIMTPVFDSVLHINENIVFPKSLMQCERMELMIANVGDKQVFLEESGKYHDVCKWKGIECNIINKVTDVKWNHHFLDLGGGYIELTHIPLTVTYFNIQSQKLQGSLIMRILPKHMKELYLTSNYLRGEINLAHLPENIKDVYLGDNFFTGSLKLQDLPVSVEYLILRQNNITQDEVTISRSIISKNLIRVDLSENPIEKIHNESNIVVSDEGINTPFSPSG